jgi:hypothetical protein
MSDEPKRVYGIQLDGHDFIVHSELKVDGQMTIAQVFGRSRVRMEMTKAEWFLLHGAIIQIILDNNLREEEQSYWKLQQDAKTSNGD